MRRGALAAAVVAAETAGELDGGTPSLAGAPILRRLDPRIRGDVESACVPRSYEPGRELVGERAPDAEAGSDGHVFVIWSGWCKAVRSHPDGATTIVGIRGPGEIAAIERLGLGSRGIAVGSAGPPRGFARPDANGTCAWVALGPVTAFAVDAALLLRAIERSGWARDEAATLMAERIVELEAALMDRLLPTEERLRRVLARFAGRPTDGDPWSARARVPLTQGDLAGMVGSTRETVNRTLQRMAAAGEITLRDGRPGLPSLRPGAHALAAD
jgi:CRP-like cAMP-binding protein